MYKQSLLSTTLFILQATQLCFASDLRTNIETELNEAIACESSERLKIRGLSPENTHLTALEMTILDLTLKKCVLNFYDLEVRKQPIVREFITVLKKKYNRRVQYESNGDHIFDFDVDQKVFVNRYGPVIISHEDRVILLTGLILEGDNKHGHECALYKGSQFSLFSCRPIGADNGADDKLANNSINITFSVSVPLDILITNLTNQK